MNGTQRGRIPETTTVVHDYYIPTVCFLYKIPAFTKQAIENMIVHVLLNVTRNMIISEQVLTKYSKASV